MKPKIFLISFLLSLPFWWGMNVLGENLEYFFYWHKIAKNPQILAAQINQQIFIEKIKRSKPSLEFEDLEIRAKAAISVEIDEKGRERILFEKNPKESLPIASLTKLMTAFVVFDLKETYDLSQEIRIGKEAINQEGSSKYGDLREGGYLSVESLVYIMLIESSNDAAFALAEPIGQEGFVGIMNLYAKDLGLEDTQFINPTGLEPNSPKEPANLSTAEDLAELAKYILEKYPQIFEITSYQSYKVLNPNGSLHHFIPTNTNELLLEIPEIVGGKTGWSPEAGGCLLLVLESPRNGYFINVILGSDDRFGEMRKLIEEVNKIQIERE